MKLENEKDCFLLFDAEKKILNTYIIYSRRYMQRILVLINTYILVLIFSSYRRDEFSETIYINSGQDKQKRKY